MVDFETQRLGDALSEAGFDRNAPAFVAWLGVSYYLQEEAFYGTLGWAASLFAGSEIVFDFMPAPSQQSPQGRAMTEQVAARVASAGEPLRSYFEPAHLNERALNLGFCEAEVVTADQVNATYFEPLGSDLRMRGYLMRACV